MTSVVVDGFAVPRRAPVMPSPDRDRSPRRPDLRVVRPVRRAAVRRAHLKLVAGGAVLFTVLLALAAFQTILVGSQQRLDELDRRVAAEQAQYQQLRLEAARLESPARIVAEATQRLGMVAPEHTSYLSPPAAALEGTALATEPTGAGGSADAAAAAPDGGDTGDIVDGPAEWAEVKPYLGDTP